MTVISKSSAGLIIAIILPSLASAQIPTSSISRMGLDQCAARSDVLSFLDAEQQSILVAGDLNLKDANGVPATLKFAVTGNPELSHGYVIYSNIRGELCKGKELVQIHILDAAAILNPENTDDTAMIRATESESGKKFSVFGTFINGQKAGQGTYISYNPQPRRGPKIINIRYSDVGQNIIDANREKRRVSRHFTVGQCYIRSELQNYAEASASNKFRDKIAAVLPRGHSWTEKLSQVDPTQHGPMADWTLGRIKDAISRNINQDDLEIYAGEYARSAGINLDTAINDTNNTQKFMIASIQKAGVTLGKVLIINDSAYQFELVSEDVDQTASSQRYCAVTASRL